MAHIHGRGQAIKKRMRKIMKEGHAVSKRLPTQEARDEQVQKLLEVLQNSRNSVAIPLPTNLTPENLKFAIERAEAYDKNRVKSGGASDEGTN